MMKMEWIVIVVLPVCLIVTLFVGCALTMLRTNNYALMYRYVGNDKIWVYPSYIGKYSFGAGNLSSGVTATSLSCHEPIPDNLKIKFENGRNEIVEKTVDVKKNIPSRFRSDRDCIIFNIDDDDEITLSFRIETGRYQWEEIDSQGNKVDFSQGKR